MHELAVTQQLVEIIAEEAKKASAKAVRRVTVRVGVLSGYFPEPVTHYYDILKAEEPLLCESQIVAVKELASISCVDCNESHETEEFFMICPACGSVNVVRSGGQGVHIDGIEIED